MLLFRQSRRALQNFFDAASEDQQSVIRQLRIKDAELAHFHIKKIRDEELTKITVIRTDVCTLYEKKAKFRDLYEQLQRPDDFIHKVDRLLQMKIVLQEAIITARNNSTSPEKDTCTQELLAILQLQSEIDVRIATERGPQKQTMTNLNSIINLIADCHRAQRMVERRVSRIEPAMKEVLDRILFKDEKTKADKPS